jgi:cytochrome c oxidase cbb3-type subunit 2
VLIAVVISIGGLVEIVPLALSSRRREPAPGVKPYRRCSSKGATSIIREGCYNCHSQMVRPLRGETERYGHYSLAGESVYDHPFQFGSKRTGPDLARVGGRYSDEWQRLHLMNPRDVVPESNMPGFPWLATAQSTDPHTEEDEALRMVGVPYTTMPRSPAPAAEVEGRTEMDALVAYLQGLGIASKNGSNEP